MSINVTHVGENNNNNNNNNSGGSIPCISVDGKRGGDMSIKMPNGEVTLNEIRVLEERASNGEYSMNMIVDGGVKGFMGRFWYQDDSADKEYKQELQQRCRVIFKEIRDKEATYKKIEEEIMSVKREMEGEGRRHHELAQEIAKKHLQRRPADFERAVEEEEKIQNWIKYTQGEMDRYLERRGGNREARPKQVPHNPVAEEMRNILLSQGNSSGIVGVVCDLAFVENEVEASLLAKLCGPKLLAVILEDNRRYSRYITVSCKSFTDDDRFQYYYNKYKNSTVPVHFLPLTNVLAYRPPRGVEDDGGNMLPLYAQQDAPKEGFLGFAVNRLFLKPQHEHLRRTLFWSLFRDGMVFETLQQGQRYREYLCHKQIHCPSIVAVQVFTNCHSVCQIEYNT
jgi:hypothetical protein